MTSVLSVLSRYSGISSHYYHIPPILYTCNLVILCVTANTIIEFFISAKCKLCSIATTSPVVLRYCVLIYHWSHMVANKDSRLFVSLLVLRIVRRYSVLVARIPQETWDVGPALAYCWPTVVDGGPTANQRWPIFAGTRHSCHLHVTSYDVLMSRLTPDWHLIEVRHGITTSCIKTAASQRIFVVDAYILFKTWKTEGFSNKIHVR